MTASAIAGRALLIACLTGTAALAETHDLQRSGLWAAYGGTDTNGQPICGIRTVGPDGRRIDIAQHDGETGIEMRLVKSSWAIPPNTPIDLVVQFDLSSPLPGQAMGEAQTVAMRMDFAQSVPFMRALRNGRQLQVSFRAGNEPTWTGGLLGSGRAIDAFNDCRARFAPPAATQPFSTQPLSPQPISAAPAPTSPTQPFTAPSAPPQPDAPALPPIPKAPGT